MKILDLSKAEVRPARMTVRRLDDVDCLAAHILWPVAEKHDIVDACIETMTLDEISEVEYLRSRGEHMKALDLMLSCADRDEDEEDL